ncbi:hypothetical protein LOTGIDRAFT_174992 [Lottia gigantea]|uniref:Ig-like domain-containing protein n=1 Tax=Lottia gigantea TaxID=225164 RepID=V4AQL8_LOTGI|nr:hypothetical protein LOTGIDRAFT_174992 [Lottia gigantea]ESO95971.1 hypothetical protein LOTGIDRAFT_174992 [Lottia gigantea]
MEYKCILIVIVYLSVLITDSPSVLDFRRNNIVVCSMINCESSSDNRYKCGCINNNNKQLYLNISNINKQDDTTWSCRGNSGRQGSINVSVYYGPENIRFNPTSDNIDVIEGKSQSVNCLADCKPDCNIIWSKDGSTTILNNTLSLSTRDQTGSYNCTVKHTVLNKQLTKQLNVQINYGPDRLTFSPDVTSINIIEDGRDELAFSPDVTSINIIEDGPDELAFSADVTSINIIEDGPDELSFSPDVTSINIIEGRDQTITCLTDCYQCNYKWTGPVSSPTKDLVLTQIKRNQEGNYRCEATNIKNIIPKTRSKSLQVNVHYPPDITSITSDAVNNTADEGSDVIFNCNVDSKPVSTVTWSFSTSTDTNTGQQWTLTQAKCQDTGIYTCTANNGIGQSTTKSLPLNIRCPPILKEELKKEIRRQIGEMVLLEINIEAYPEPNFIWKQLISDIEYPFAKTERVSENNFISTLELILDQSSFGYYIITVQNIINGETKAKTWGIKIIELDPGTISYKQSGYQEVLSTGIGIGIGIGISLVCVFLVLLTIFIYRKYHPANKKLPEES